MGIIASDPASGSAYQGESLRGRIARFLRSVLLFLASIPAATGCNAMSETETTGTESFRDQQSTAEARVQIDRWLGPGATLAGATQALRARGFKCDQTMPRSTNAGSSVFCIYQTPPPPPPEQRVVSPQTPVNWIVSLESQDGVAITGFTVSRSPQLPGE